MSRFDVTQDDYRLCLTMPVSTRLLTRGALAFFSSVFVLTLLGVIALVQEEHAKHARNSVAASEFFDPGLNQFAFLWLVCCILMLVLVPFYVYSVHRSRLIFTFNRVTNTFLCNGRVITPLNRIEQVSLRRNDAPDDPGAFGIYLIYGDGHEMLIDDAPDATEIDELAYAIADFVGVAVLRKARVPHPS